MSGNTALPGMIYHPDKINTDDTKLRKAYVQNNMLGAHIFLWIYLIVFFILSVYFSRKFSICMEMISNLQYNGVSMNTILNKETLSFSFKSANDSQIAHWFFWHTPIVNIITASYFFQRVNILFTTLEGATANIAVATPITT